MLGPSPLSLARVVAIGVVASLLGCGKSADTRGDTAARSPNQSAALGATERPADLASIVSSALSGYTYGPAQDPVDASKPDEFEDPDGEKVDPKMTFAKATWVSGDTTNGKMLGRIVSQAPVRKLGILRDTNYVWQDRTRPNNWKVYIVPQDALTSATELHRSGPFTDTHHPGTHLVKATRVKATGSALVFGICSDDCPTGHCGFQ